MSFDLGKFLQGAVAQINPWDNGADFNSVYNKKKKKQETIQQPMPQQFQQQGGATARIGQEDYKQRAAQHMAQIDANIRKTRSEIMSPLSVLSDVGKATGQVAGAIGKGVSDFATGTAQEYNKRANDVGNAAATVIREATGQNQAYDQHMRDLASNANQTDINLMKRLKVETDPARRAALNRALHINAGGTANRFLQDMQKQNLAATDPRKTLVNAANSALDVVTLGKGRAIMDGIKAGERLTMPVARQLAKNTLTTGYQGAGIGAAYGGVNTAADPNATINDYARNMAQGGLMGAGIGIGAQVALPVAGVAANKAIRTTGTTANYVANASVEVPRVVVRKQAAQHPEVLGHDPEYQNLERAWETTNDPVARRGFADAMAANRAARLETQRRIERQMLQGGYHKNPLANEQQAQVATDPLQALKQEALKYKSADEFIKAIQDGKVEVPKFDVNDPQLAQLQKQLGIDYTNSYDTPTGVYDMQKKAVTDLYNQAHAQSAPIEKTGKVKATKGQPSTELGKQKRNPLSLPLENQAIPKGSSASKTPVSLDQRPFLPGEQKRTATQFEKVKAKNASSSNTRVQQKIEVVNEGKRALNGNDRTTYGLVDSFKDSENVPNELKNALGAFGNERTVRSNKELWQTAQKRVVDDPAGAMKYFSENNSDDAVATGYALINRYMKDGNAKAAGELSINMAERALEAGRTTQAYALMKRLTPEGTISYVEKKVLRFQKDNPKMAQKMKWDDATRQDLYQMSDNINKMPDGRERNLEIGRLQEKIDNIFPSSIADKAITVWKAGLLTSLRTHERNILGNSINSASEQAATYPGSLADRIMALRTGKRTLVSSGGEGLVKGSKVGGQMAKDQLLTGIDVTQSNLKYNINHITWNDTKVEKALKVYTEAVFRPLGAEDKIFKESIRKNALYNQAQAMAKNKKLKGAEADNFVENLVENPTARMRDIAEQDASRATFTHDNFLGTMIQNAKATVRRSNAPGAKAASTFLDFLMPFTQVPSGVASQLYAYSPLKLTKSMYDIGKVLVTGDGTLQRTAAQGFGRSALGTALIGAGAILASNKLMTGNPKDDAEKAQWEAQGIKPNSVKIAGRWYSLQSIGPQFILALAGSQFVQDQEKGDNPYTKLGANLGNNFSQQTFLKGINSFADALNDPDRYAQSLIEQQAASIIPNIVKDIAKATDPNEREARGVVDKFKQGIPGASRTLPERRDSLGQPFKNSGVFELIDLFNSSSEKDIPESKYVEVLRQATGSKEQIPTKADSTIQINGESKRLTSKEYSDYQKYIGEKSKEYLAAAMKDPAFQKLSQTDQVKKINSQLQDINAAAKYELFGNVSKDGKLDKGVANIVNTGKAKVDASLISGTTINSKLSTPSTDVLNKYYSLSDKERSTWFSKENDAEYKYYKAKYENDKANGTISKIEDIKRTRELKHSEIGAKYSKDTRDLYDLNKAQIYDYVTKSKDGKKLANELLAYDQALYNAGLTKYLKFKTGLAPSARGGRRGGRGGHKGSGFKLPTTSASNKAAKETLAELSRLLAGTTAKNQIPKQIGRKVALKKITVKA